MNLKIEWERKIIDLIIDKLEIPNGDAQGIFEANESLINKEWIIQNSPENVANIIINS